MASIVNGLFSARSGISAHGAAIAVVGDNISNSSTIGFKGARAEFEDLIAGGQASGRVIGAGSQVNAVNTVFQQGTLEFTGRNLDLAVDGNGFFVLEDNGQRVFTRAGNFRVDAAGYIVNQDGLRVQGFPSGGTGALEALTINSVSQDSVATRTVDITGNLDARADIIAAASIPAVTAPNATTPSTTTYAQLSDAAEFSTVVDVFDSLGAKHTLTYFFFHTGANQYTVRGYASASDVDTASTSNLPRLVTGSTDLVLNFDGSGQRTGTVPLLSGRDKDLTIAWNNGSSTSTIELTLNPFTQYASPSNILSITQDGKGIGTVGNLSIESNGEIFALLDNGQAAVIGRLGMVNFSNPEGLVRIGSNLLQQSPSSGEPVIGRPATGTFGSVQAGSLELSTVDIANEFVKLITLQRGFQANSRIITTINQLLNEIIQLA